MEQALDGGRDNVLHVTVTVTDVQTSMPTPEGLADLDLDLADYADQVWIDAANGVARVETKARTESDSTDRVTRTIVRSDGTFHVDSDGNSRDVESLTCRGSDSALLAQLMRCGNYLEKSTTTVQSATADGRPAIVLVTTGELPSEDWSAPFEHRLSVDPALYLPVGAELSETLSGGNSKFDMQLKQRYDIDFVDRSSLADDFFELSSIGYAEKDPAANLRADVDGMRVYWLGLEFDPGTGGAPLVLLRTSTPGGQFPPGYRSTVTYELKGGRRNYPVISLQEFPIEAWEELKPDSAGHIWNAAGVTREDVTIPGGRAVLFRVRASYERYIAHVYFDTTVILIGDADQPSPYANREAMLALIKGLRPFE
ncbi:MAG: hypothetical protein EPO22_12060 [Dehalococcoidia bacterium]|nr:MAG: hypothetical protein EPO22_12060 [Dehalococcoidia bacterium]